MRILLRTLIMGVSCLLVLLFAPIHGQAMITSVSIHPEQPNSQDTVVFTIEGEFPDYCWYLEEFNFSQQSPTEFTAIINAMDRWRPGMYCGQMFVDYQYTANLGLLDPGDYTVFVTELHESIRDSLPDYVIFSFVVAVPSESADSPSDIPHDYCLAPCYPNPFNPSTTISFNLPMTTQASLVVYNLAGQAVKTLVDDRLSAGSHSITFDGARLSSGVYFYTLYANDYTVTKKMLLLK